MLSTISSRVHENYYVLGTFPVYIPCGTIHFNLGYYK